MVERDEDAARVAFPPPFVFLAALVLGYALDQWVHELRIPLVGWQRWLAASSSGVLGVVALGAAVRQFSRTGQDPKPWKTTPAIIESGVYAFTRNPMYVGMALVQMTIATMTLNGWILALTPVSLAVVYVVAVRHEEAYLEAKFGDAYLEYKRRVSRWV